MVEPAKADTGVAARSSPARHGPALLVMAVGVLAVGSAAILIRQLKEAGPLAAAGWRLAFAAMVLAPRAITPLTTTWPGLTAKERRRLLAAALALALHFGLWIPSLRFTSVASSVALVTVSPVFVALLSPRLLGETVRPRAWLGIAFALSGALALLIAPSSGTAPLAGAFCLGLPCPMVGKGMALGGAVAVAYTFIVRRQSHARVPLLAFMLSVYSIASLLLLAAAWLIEGPPLGYAPGDWALLLGLALLPQLVGHGSFNWALARLPAALVVTAVLGEPVVGTVLAWLILGEAPTPILYLAGGAILVGVLLVAQAQTPRSRSPQAPPTPEA